MLNSKDLTVIIIMAVLGLVLTVLVGQVATIITGVPGANYFLVIIFAIQTSFALLLYEGRRWRFFAQMTLFTFLIIPTYIGGIPFDLLSKINLIVNSFQCDLLFNSVHGTFKKQNKLVWWAILVTLEFWLLNPLFGVLIKSLLLYPPEFMMTFIGVLPFLLPAIIGESTAGGFIGYKIYKRVENLI
jgi:hypothetical protein